MSTHKTVIVKRQLEPGSTPFATEKVSTALSDFPYNEHLAPIAIFNGQGSGVKLNIKLLNCRPLTGPQNATSLVDLRRITAMSGGDTLTPVKLDSGSADLPSQVRAAVDMSSVTGTTSIRRDFICSGANFTRTLANLTSMLNGDSRVGLDSGEFLRSTGADLDCQKHTLREGQGIAVRFITNGPTFCFGVSVVVRDVSTGACYRFNDMIEPRFRANAYAWGIINGAGSGVVLELSRIQIRELGTSDVPTITYEPIDGICWESEDAIHVMADSSESLPAEVYIKKNCVTMRAGAKYGGIITSPAYRRLTLAEPPWGPGITGGPQIARRGVFSPDMDTRGAAPITLSEGQGIALFIRTPSAQLFHEFTATIDIEGQDVSGVYPDPNDVRDGVDYGPSGTEYDGDLVLPVIADVKSGVSYGADGTEYTGTYAGGGGGSGVSRGRITNAGM